MIIIKLSNGLGNQMFEYAFGVAQAKRKATALKIDTSNYGKKGEKRPYELDQFLISAKTAEETDLKAIKLPAKLFRSWQKKRPAAKRRLYSESNFTYDPDVLLTGQDVLFVGNWQSEKYFLDAATEVRREFTLRSWSKLSASFKKQIETGPGTPISIHVRRGDYVADARTAVKHGALPVEYYTRACEMISMKVSNPVFYVFSDDIPWCRANLDFVKPAVMVSDPELSHAEEISLMSLCKHHVIANSSFSWWGAWLDAKADKIVIAPKSWFQTTADTRDLIPASWLQI